MIDYDTIPNYFSDECITAVETVHREIRDGGDDWWFRIQHKSYDPNTLEIYFNTNEGRSLDIWNSPVFRSYIAGELLENCLVERVTGYGFDSWQSEFDLWFGYKIRNEELVELELCPTETSYRLFCEDL